MKHYTDTNHLKAAQYRDSSNLDARIALHLRFSTNPQGWPRWYFEQLDIPPEAQILELGCGPGSLWRDNADRIPKRWQITLTDISPGMLDDARQNLGTVDHAFSFREANIGAIPYPEDSFDTVIATYMLYHVPDRTHAFSEIHRVLRRHGRFYAATNGKGHLNELRELMHATAETVPIEREIGFSLENGAEQLAPWFEHIEMRRYEDELRVTEAEPLRACINSMRDFYDLNDQQLADIGRHVDEEMARRGSIRISKATGMFEAW